MVEVIATLVPIRLVGGPALGEGGEEGEKGVEGDVEREAGQRLAIKVTEHHDDDCGMGGSVGSKASDGGRTY